MEKTKRVTVDTREYVSMLRELTEQGHEVSMMIAGNSMSPFLVHQRDGIVFKKPDRELRRGDIVFYERMNGQFVCHRICRIRPEGFYLIGDAQIQVEGPIRREQIFGLITGVMRKGKRLAPGDFWWEFFEKVWLRIFPLRRPLVRLYAVVRSFGRKMDRNADTEA
ncbi:MAG: S24/S26 family peptidase [Lachnospiraceae bacterium]|nr:S24/S26 family peptidase [Lachnospiraceae bacterium]MCD7765839.1 S24/S26 family peptidase [Lachnospiraceae bacterium]